MTDTPTDKAPGDDPAEDAADDSIITMEDLHAATVDPAFQGDPEPAGEPVEAPGFEDAGEPEPDDIPTYELPERLPLDAYSAAALAVNEELAKQVGESGAQVVINPGPVVDAALGAAEGWPRIPAWTGDPRRIGGITRPDQARPEPEVTLTVDATGTLQLQVAIDVDGRDVTGTATVEAWQAEAWFLAGLAACAAGRAAQENQPAEPAPDAT